MAKPSRKKLTWLIAVFFLLLSGIAPAWAADSGFEFNLNVPIGELKTFTIANGNNSLLGSYIQAWYGFLLGTVGIMATLMIMWGGFKYLTSRGDKGMIDSAKNIIISAITGVVLAFGSYTILSVVNPALLKINMPGLTSLQGGESVVLDATHTTAPSVAGNIGSGGYSGTKIDCSQQDGLPLAYTASFEGYDATPRPDGGVDKNGNQKYTWGYGHNGINPPAQVDQATEQAWFAEHYANDYRALASSSYGPGFDQLDQPTQAALTDIAYQYGSVGGFISNVASLVSQGNRSGAADYMRNANFNALFPNQSEAVRNVCRARANANANIISNSDANSRQQLFESRAKTSCP